MAWAKLGLGTRRGGAMLRVDSLQVDLAKGWPILLVGWRGGGGYVAVDIYSIYIYSTHLLHVSVAFWFNFPQRSQAPRLSWPPIVSLTDWL